MSCRAAPSAAITGALYYRSLDTLDLGSLSANGFPGRNLWNNTSGGFRDRRIPSFGPEAVDPNIKPMSSDLTNAGTEIQLGARTVFRANYVHNNLRRTMEDVGVLINGDEHYSQVNPGEGLGATMLGTCGGEVSARLHSGFRDAEAEARVRRDGTDAQPPVQRQDVRELQLCAQPVVRQLCRAGELG